MFSDAFLKCSETTQNNLRQESLQVLTTPKSLACKSLQVYALIFNSQHPVTNYGKYHLCILGHFGFDFYID